MVSSVKSTTGCPRLVFFLVIFLFVAASSIGVKCLAVQKLAPLWFIPLLYYLSYYLLEYEMSGIRQAIAMGFAMVSIIYVEGKKVSAFCYMHLVRRIFPHLTDRFSACILF